MKQLNFQVDDLVYVKLGNMARDQGGTISGYARMLFEAAYAARFRQSGDPDLDAAVGAAVIMHAAKQDSAAIARALKIGEHIVVKILDLWKRETARA